MSWDIEKIVLAKDSGIFCVVWGTEEDWSETRLVNKGSLVPYLMGLMNGLGVPYTNIYNGPDEASEWSYVGKPLEEKDFRDIIEPLRNYCMIL